jgi:adenosylcobinamide-GDP ribazoletransferase
MRSLFLAFGMFSALPVPADRVPAADRSTSAAALRWMPLVGAVLGALGTLAALVFWRGYGVGSPLLGAVVVVAVLALLTRGLHLDGLADVVDGLGSGRPAEQALEIMKRSDIGPFGVAALVLVLLVDVAALTSILSTVDRPTGLVVVLGAAGSARLAALWAANAPAARPGGFGALVAGSATRAQQAAVTAAAAAVTVCAAALSGVDGVGLVWLLAAGLVGQLVAAALRRHVVRRLGGTTGDVFGALVETALTATLLALAAVLSWRGHL